MIKFDQLSLALGETARKQLKHYHDLPEEDLQNLRVLQDEKIKREIQKFHKKYHKDFHIPLILNVKPNDCNTTVISELRLFSRIMKNGKFQTTSKSISEPIGNDFRKFKQIVRGNCQLFVSQMSEDT